jgi:glycosyltransferase involved in cell wall biosynthesis
MNDTPLASFTLCSYQQSAFVREAVRGALAQTYSPLEILIYDDASTDGTWEIIQEEVAGYDGPHSVVLHQNKTNLGSRANHLATLNDSKGLFVVLADGDDVSHPDRTSRTVDAFVRRGVSVVTCNGYVFDEGDGKAVRMHRDPNGPIDDTIEELVRDGSNALTFGPGIALSREMIEIFGLPPARFEAGDLILPFWGALLSGCHFVGEPLVKYRLHAGNSCVGRRVERATGIEKTVQEERQWYLHSAIALWEMEQLDNFAVANPEKTGLRDRLNPHLIMQILQHANAWVDSRQKLDAAGNNFVGRSGKV